MSTVQLPLEEEKRVDEEMEAWVETLLNESSRLNEQSAEELEGPQFEPEEASGPPLNHKGKENGVR